MSKKVLVFAETKDGKLRNVSFEAITVGQELSEGGEVIVSLFGDRCFSICSRSKSIWSK